MYEFKERNSKDESQVSDWNKYVDDDNICQQSLCTLDMERGKGGSGT